MGGLPAQNADFIDAVYGNFPLMIALIAMVTFILLARAFRSLLLPLKAVILNVASVAAAWGVLALMWQHGHGSDLLWGIDATGSVPAWIPLMVFAFLFGLSMDYEVFILSRMREEYDATGDTRTAVVRGIGRTGRLVTSAALILFLAFVSLASGPGTDLKMFATGLAAGILLDATVIRALLVPGGGLAVRALELDPAALPGATAPGRAVAAAGGLRPGRARRASSTVQVSPERSSSSSSCAPRPSRAASSSGAIGLAVDRALDGAEDADRRRPARPLGEVGEREGVARVRVVGVVDEQRVLADVGDVRDAQRARRRRGRRRARPRRRSGSARRARAGSGSPPCPCRGRRRRRRR